MPQALGPSLQRVAGPEAERCKDHRCSGCRGLAAEGGQERRAGAHRVCPPPMRGTTGNFLAYSAHVLSSLSSVPATGAQRRTVACSQGHTREGLAGTRQGPAGRYHCLRGPTLSTKQYPGCARWLGAEGQCSRALGLLPRVAHLRELREQRCLPEGLGLVLPGWRGGGGAHGGEVQEPGHSPVLSCSLPSMQVRATAPRSMLLLPGMPGWTSRGKQPQRQGLGLTGALQDASKQARRGRCCAIPVRSVAVLSR